jgi:ABC-type hemin transport system substrate-binding protein
MSLYSLPEIAQRPAAAEKTVYTVASGDLRLAANVKC